MVAVFDPTRPPMPRITFAVSEFFRRSRQVWAPRAMIARPGAREPSRVPRLGPPASPPGAVLVEC